MPVGGNGVFRILVGVDGSTPSRRALEGAVEEAQLRAGEVFAVTAWAFPPVRVVHHSPAPVLVIRSRPGAGE